jgi:hypothetical protein
VQAAANDLRPHAIRRIFIARLHSTSESGPSAA